MNTTRRILRRAIAPIVEPLERRQLLSTTALFSGGNSSSTVDAYPGKAASGWATPWNTETSYSTITSASTASTSPLNGGANYMSLSTNSTSSNAVAGISRGYSTANGVDTGSTYMVTFDYRVDSSLSSFTNINDRAVILGNSVATYGTSSTNTWVIAAYGATNGSVVADDWGFQNGDKLGDSTQNFVDTGVPLVQGRTYHFAITVDPASNSYTAIVSDGQIGTDHSYSSSTLGFRTSASFNSSTTTYVNFDDRRNSSSQVLSYSFDSLTVSGIASSVPSTPTGLSATPISASQVNLAWTDAGSDAGLTGYNIARSTSAAGPFTQVAIASPDATSFNDTGLTAGTTYYYEIAASNSAGDSTYTSTVSATPNDVPAAPSGLTATASSPSQIALSWTSNSTNQTGFKVERSTDGTTYTLIETTSASATSYTDTSAVDGTQYYYDVIATNGSGDSDASNVATATTPLSSPTGLIATASGTQTNLAWTINSTDQSGFLILRSTDGATYTTVTTTSSTATTYSDVSLTAGTTYYYEVEAEDASTTSPAATASVTLVPAAPGGLTATAASSSQINLNWSDVTGETGFLVERSPDGSSSWTQIAAPSTGVLAYSDTGLATNTTYYYRIQSANAAGGSGWSSVAAALTNGINPAAPSGLSAITNSSTQITLTWTNNATNQMGFKVERSTSSAGTYTQIGTTTSTITTYVDTGVSAGTAYYYRVRATNASGDSAYTSITSATTPNTSTVALFSGGNGSSSSDQFEGGTGNGWATAWTTPEYQSTINSASVVSTSPLNGGSNYLSIATTTLSNATVSYGMLAGASRAYSSANGVSTGATHVISFDYRLDSSTSGFSAINDRVMIFGDSTAIYGQSSSNTWVVGAFGATDGALPALTWGFQDGDNNQTFSSTGVPLVQGTVYHFVITVNPTDNSYTATISDGLAGTDHTYASGTLGFRSGTSFTSTTDTYINFTDRRSTTSAATTFSVDSLTISPVASSVPAAPAGLTATAASSSTINLSWTAGSGLTGYDIARSTSAAGPFTQVAIASPDATSFNDTGLTAGTTYYYEIAASNSAGDSTYTSTVSATPNDVPAAPSGLTATASSPSQIALSWTSNSTNQTGFKVERSTDGTTYTLIETTSASATSYTDTSAVDGTQYYYDVIATNDSGDSDASNVVTATTPLSAPTGLIATASGTQTNLAWTINSTDQSGFLILRSTDGATYTTVTTTSSTATTYSDVSLTAGTAYYYEVEAVDASTTSPAATASVTLVPAAPGGLTATAASSSQINLNWSDVTGETGFLVERSPDGSSSWTQIATPSTGVLAFSDTGLATSTTYYYRVFSTNSGGNSTDADTSATTLTVTGAGTGNGLDGEYFDTTSLSQFQLARIDPTVNFNWSSNAPDSSMAQTNFSVRWSGDVQPQYSETYIFSTTTDDGARLWVNGQLLIDQWQAEGATQSSGSIALQAGQKYAIEMDYYQGSGDALAQLAWSSPTQTQEIIPESQLYASDATSPAVPSSLTVVAISTTQINLDWSASPDDESGFIIERKAGANGAYAQIGSTGANVTNFADTSVITGTDYFYRVEAVNAQGVSSVSNVADTSPVPTPASDAVFFGEDDSTSGNWKGAYGVEGYNIVGDASSYPSYVALASAAPEATWTGSTSDSRALRKGESGSTDRIAASLYGQSFDVDLTFNDTEWHRITAYALDWDSTARVETINVENADTGAVLDSESISSFQSGKYLSWVVKGDIQLNIVETAGANAVLSGIFFDAAPVTSPPAVPVDVAANFTTDSVNVGWSDSDSGATGFEIQRASSESGTFQHLADVSGSSSSYRDSTARPGGTYVYRIRATNNGIASSFSDDATVQTPSVGLPFEDNFDLTPDNEPPGYGWDDAAFGWRVVNGQLLSGTSSQQMLADVSALNASVTLDYDMGVPEAGGGLVLRSSSQGEYRASIVNYYNVTFFAKIERITATGDTIGLAQGYVDLSHTSGHLEFQADGSDLDLYLDGNLVAHAVDNSIQTAGGIGIYSIDPNTIFDNFTADLIPTATQSAVTLPYTDAFDTTGQLAGSVYENVQQYFLASNGEAEAPEQNALAVIPGIQVSDVAITADVSCEGGIGARNLGFVLRASGNTMYRGEYNFDAPTISFDISKEINGVWTTLATTSTVFGIIDSGKLRFDAIGDTLTLFFNDQLVLTVQDSSITSPGSVGLWSSYESGWGPGSFDNLAVEDSPLTAASSVINEVFNTIQYEPYAGWMKSVDATEETGSGNDWDQAVLLATRLQALGYSTKYEYGRVQASYTDVDAWLGVEDSTQALAVLTAAGLDPVTSEDDSSVTFDHAWIEANLRTSTGLQWFRLDPSWKFENRQPGVTTGFQSLPSDIQADASTGAYSALLLSGQSPLDYFTQQLGEALASSQLSLSQATYDGPIIARGYEQLLQPPSYTVITSTLTDENAPVPDDYTQYVRIEISSTGGLIDQLFNVADIATEPIILSSKAGVYSLTVGSSSYGAISVAGTDIMTIEVESYKLGQDTTQDLPPGDPGLQTFTRTANEVVAVGLNAGQISDQLIHDTEAQLNDLASRKRNDEDLAATYGTEYLDDLLTLGEWTYLQSSDQQRTQIAGLTGNIAVRTRVESGLMTGTGITQELYAEDQNLQYPVLPTRLHTDNPDVGTGVTLVPIQSGLLDSSQLLEISRFIGENDSALEQSTVEQIMNAPAMSTLQAFRWAAQNNVDIVAVTSISQVPTLLAGLSSAEQSAIISAINLGYSIWAVSEEINTSTWQGAAWIQEQVVDGQVQRQYEIMRSGSTVEGGGDSDASVGPAPVDPTPVKPTDVSGTQANPASGDATVDVTDFSLPNIGLPVDFSRHYDSFFDPSLDPSSKMVDDGMGVGWVYTFGDFLTFTAASDDKPATAVWHTSAGLRLTFTYVPSLGTYENPTGTYGTFENLGGGEYADLAPDGTQYYFKGLNGSTVLDRIVDRNNNVLQVNYSGGHATQIWAGTTTDFEQRLLITLTYYSPSDTGDGDAPGHIATVEDDTGRTWNFSYTNLADPYGVMHVFLAAVQGPTGTDAQSTSYDYYGQSSGDSLTYPRLAGLLHAVTDNLSGAEQIYSYYANRRVFSVSDEIVGSTARTEYLSYDLYHQTTEVTDFNGDATTLYYTPDLQIYKTVMPDGSQATSQYAGADEAGLFDDGIWKLDLNSSQAGETHTILTFTFGQAGDQPVVGDWTGNGADSVGVFRIQDGEGYFYLDSSGSHILDPNKAIDFGPVDADAVPIVGDWSNDGITDLGIYEDGEFILDTNGDGHGDDSFTFDSVPSGAVPVAGDWTGNGQTGVGLYADGTFYLDTNNVVDASDVQALSQTLSFSVTSDDAAQPIVGYWGAANISELGISTYDGSNYAFNLDANNDRLLNGASSDVHRELSDSSGAIAIVGNWDGNGVRGFALAQTDAIGRTTRQMQNADGNPVWIVGVDGQETMNTFQAAYNGSNSSFAGVTEVRILGRGATPDDRVTHYTYDNNGNALSVEDPLGDVTAMGYDVQGRLISSTAPRGVELIDGTPTIVNAAFTTTYAYQSGTDLVIEEAAGGGLVVTSNTYNDAGDLLSTTQGSTEDGAARTITYAVDALGDVLSTSVPGADGDDVTNATYTDGLLTDSTDPDGHTTQYTRDLLGRVTQTTFADETSTTVQYDADGNITAQTDELGHVTQFFYDSRGKLVETLYADGTYALTLYDGAGRAISSANQLGETTFVTYDSDDRKTSITQPDPDGTEPLTAPITTYHYDDLGLVEEDDPANHTTAYLLDQLGRVVQTVTYLRDSSGNAVQLYGTLTRTQYDADGNVIEQDQYDATGLTTIPSDPAVTLASSDRSNIYAYDPVDRKISQILADPDGPSGPQQAPQTTYSYDSSGNLVAVTDPLGHTTVTLYDAQNRVIGTGEDEQVADISATDGIATISLDLNGLDTGDRVLIRGASNSHYNGVFTVTRIDDNEFSFAPSDGDTSTFSGSVFVAVSAVSNTYDPTGNLASATDARGEVTSYTYDARNRRITQTTAGDLITQFGYDAAGNLTSITDPRGFTTTYTYDALNRKIAQQDPDSSGTPGATDGPLTQYAYDAAGNLVATTDPLGHVTFTVYDALNRAVATAQGGLWGTVQVSDVAGVWTATVTLLDHGLQVGERFAAGAGTDRALSGVFIVAEVIDANTFTYVLSQVPTTIGGAIAISAFATSKTYQQDGQVATSTDVQGHTTTYDYDAAGNLSSEILPDAAGYTDASDSPTTSYTYDGFGELAAMTSPRGNLPGADPSLFTTTYQYDALGRRISSTQANPDGVAGEVFVAQNQYDADGNLLSTTDPLGIEATTVYDNQNRPILVAQGEQSAQLTVTGTTATVTLQNHGFGSGERVYVTWGSNGQYGGIETITCVNSDVFTFSVSGDTGGSGIQAAIVAATIQQTAYDASGNIIAVTDARGDTTEYEYDALNRKIEQIDPAADGTAGAGGVTTYSYDADGNLISVIDPIGNSSTDPSVQALHQTSYIYDALDRKIAQILPDADGNPATINDRPTTTYTYDLDGNLSSVTDPLGNATSYGYDLLNRKISETDPAVSDSGSSPVHPVTSYTYDATGNLLSMIDSRGNTTSYTYDALNRKISETQPDADGTGAPVTTYSYDVEGNLVSTTDPLGHTTQYTYDSLDRRVSMQQPDADSNPLTTGDSPLTQMSYDADGRLISTTDPLGHITLSQYDALGRVVGTGQAAQSANVQADGLVATVTLAGHHFLVGDYILISSTDAGSVGFDGIFVITAVSTDTFSYDLSSAPSNSSGGDILVGESAASTRFDATGNVVSSVDPLGRTTTFEYDALGRKTRQTLPDPDGDPDLSNAPVTTYGYDLNGNLVSVTDPRGNETTYDYDALNRKIGETDPLPDADSATHPVTQYTYDLDGNLIAETDPRGATTEYLYDALNRRVEEIQPDAAGNTAAEDSPITYYAYDLDGNLTSTTDPLGRITSDIYDSLNRKIEQIDPDADGNSTTTGDTPITTYQYDKDGNVISVTDALGNVPDGDAAAHTTNYAYDALDRKVLEIRPVVNGVVSATRYGYDNDGNVIWIIDALGNQALGSEPSAADIQAMITSHLHTTTYGYDAQNRKVIEIDADPDGNSSTTGDIPVTTFGYDADGELIWTTSPNGNAYSGLFNNVPLTVSPTPASTFTTYFAYDGLGRKIEEIDPAPDGTSGADGPVTRYGYDANGNLIWTIDALGNQLLGASPTPEAIAALVAAHHHTTTTTYDALNRKIEDDGADADGNPATAGDTPVTLYSYDLNGNLVSETDSSDNVTQYAYDALNRQTGETINAAVYGNVSETTGYDADGEESSTTDFDGQVRDFTYNNDGWLIQEVWHDASGTAVNTINNTYDVAGRLLTTSDDNSSYTYTYDALGRLLSSDNIGTPNQPHIVLTYQYDANGRNTVTLAAVNGVADLSESYAYDDLNRITSITQGIADGAGEQVSFTYDRNSQILQTDSKNGTEGPLADLLDCTYSYDNDGRLISIEHSTSAGTSLADYSYLFDADGRITQMQDTDGETDYSYDDNGQLTGAAGSAVTVGENYQYDSNGNRITVTNAAGSGTYTVGADNRLTSDGTYNYEYDKDGNRIERTSIATGDVTIYSYDTISRLTQVTEKSAAGTVLSTVTYAYDVNGNRLSQTVDSNGDGTPDTIERYGYDGSSLLYAFDGSNTITDRFLQTPGEADRPLADQNAATGTVTWQLADQEGTIRDTIDSSAGGSLSSVRHVQFDAYGNVIGTNQPLRFGYTGHEQDAATGLVYMDARYYDPCTGEFVSQDPLNFGGGDSNLYRYVSNSTPNLTDPLGLSAEARRSAVVQPKWQNDPWVELGDVFSDFGKSFDDLLRGHGKDSVDDLIDSGGSFDRTLGVESSGLDLGWINFSAGAVGDDNTASFGIFGLELELDHNTSSGRLNYNVGAHIGFGIGAGASVSAGYIDDTASLGVTFGVASTSLSLTHGRLSEGLNIGLISPPPGEDGVGVGYGWTFGPDGSVTGGFDANVSANNFANRYLGMSGINSAYDQYQRVVGSGLGLFDGGKAIQSIFKGYTAATSGGGTTYQPNPESPANPFLPPSSLLTYSFGPDGVHFGGPLYNAVTRIGNTSNGTQFAAASVVSTLSLLNQLTLSTRIYGGLAASVIDGDVLDDPTKINTLFGTGKDKLLFSNGVFNTQDDARKTLSQKLSPTLGISSSNSSTAMNGSNWRIGTIGIGDLLQIIPEELGLIDLPAIREASAIQAAAMSSLESGGGSDGETSLHVVAHSQGAEVFLRSLDLLDDQTRSMIDYHGFGGEAVIGSDLGLGHVSNEYDPEDPLRLITEIKHIALGWAGNPEGTLVPTTPVPTKINYSFSHHLFVENYLPRLIQEGLRH